MNRREEGRVWGGRERGKSDILLVYESLKSKNVLQHFSHWEVLSMF